MYCYFFIIKQLHFKKTCGKIFGLPGLWYYLKYVGLEKHIKHVLSSLQVL